MARRVGKHELVGGWVAQRVRQGVRRQRHCFIEGRPLHQGARGRGGGGSGAADEEEERQHLLVENEKIGLWADQVDEFFRDGE